MINYKLSQMQRPPIFECLKRGWLNFIFAVRLKIINIIFNEKKCGDFPSRGVAKGRGGFSW